MLDTPTPPGDPKPVPPPPPGVFNKLLPSSTGEKLPTPLGPLLLPLALSPPPATKGDVVELLEEGVTDELEDADGVDTWTGPMR
jgi:hypothetical protein